jgi:hypothetical protein
MLAELAEFQVQGGVGDGTFLDIDDESVVMTEEAEDESLLGFVPLAADEDAVAVMVGGWAGDSGLDRGFGEPADTAEQFGDLALFDFELSGVIEVLILATAALTEVGTTRRDAVGGRFQDAQQACAGELFFDLGDFGVDDLAGDDKGDEDDEGVMAGDPFAAEREVVDGQLECIADLDGGG